MSKLVKHVHGCTDRLSGLPDSVLSHILSFLPTTKQAVRTSVLSTRWRYLYTSVATLAFADHVRHPSDGFANFVDRVLSSHDTSCIERFHLRCVVRNRVNDFTNRICGWISFALGKRVQELYLRLYNLEGPSGILPATLFTNKTLVKFVLRVSVRNEFLMTIPAKVCFPNLKTLHLIQVDFVDDESLRRLFSGCPVLEELSMSSSEWKNLSEINISNTSLKSLTIDHYDPACDFDSTYVPHLNVVIDAPRLVSLKLSAIVAKSFLLTNLHSLVNARLEDVFFKDFSQGTAATNLLKGIDNAQSLYVSVDILRHFSLYNKPKPLPVFQNLVLLDITGKGLGYKYTSKCWNEIVLVEFLASSPNLETLIFDTEGFRPSRKNLPSCHLFGRLKVIGMKFPFEKDIRVVQFSLKLVEYFLKNASGLEKLTLLLFLGEREELEIAKKVSMFPRESKKCQVEIV